ncbi:hypothetical protein OH76DRAFT_712638 [Lentinus brumalis]|uniref:Mid2 domain-containing protein n=1 Tax=Lentinus brumalis TaxID=2498619 RepID=A0A371D5G2_9APHY|nr:hypothetical protein OH76DRAFT_712638 [Polyporus brumalis]
MSTRRSALLFAICLGFIQACSGNFTFTYGAATECDDFDVSWTGGTPPFRLTFVPEFQAKIDLDISPKYFSNNRGSYTTSVPLKSGNKTVVVMSDATGFGSGGVSPLITVGNSQGPACDINDTTKNHFVFVASDALTQCDNFMFKEYDNATQPVTITGVVVGGSTFVLNPPTGSKNFTWVVNVAAGTQLLFLMTDSANRQGGTTSVLTVGQSANTQCLDSSSPTIAVSPPYSTSTGTQTGNLSGSSSTSTLKTGPLVAAVVVPVVAVTAVIIAAFLWYRRLRRNTGVRVLGRPPRPEIDLAMGDEEAPPRMREVGSSSSAVPLLHGRSPSVDDPATHGSYFPRVPPTANSHFTECLSPDSVYSDSTQGNQYGAMSTYGSSHGGSSQYSGASGSAAGYASSSGRRTDSRSGARRKAAEAGMLTPPGNHPPAQFILHTDIEDTIPPPPPVVEVVELPPQYSERPAPPAASGSGAQPPPGDASSPQP